MQDYMKPEPPKTKFKPLKILTYPNQKLRRKSLPIKVDRHLSDIQKLIDQMFKTMKFFNGVGLAAPQVGVGFRVIVVDIQDGKMEPLALINPEIVKIDGEVETEEGCLSFPQMNGFIKRSQKIAVKYLDYNGEEKILEADGLLSICIQHEIDHLNGILFIDRVSRLKREMILKRVKKLGRNDV